MIIKILKMILSHMRQVTKTTSPKPIRAQTNHHPFKSSAKGLHRLPWCRKNPHQYRETQFYPKNRFKKQFHQRVLKTKKLSRKIDDWPEKRLKTKFR